MKIELGEAIVYDVQLARAATFNCDFDEAERLTKLVGELVCSLVSKELHGNTFQVPGRVPPNKKRGE